MTLKDEYPDLLPGNERAKSVADATLMLEELIGETLNDGHQQINWNDKVVESTLQVHCHEQALMGTEAALKAMNIPPNYSTKLLEAGCCGMAGSFGFEKKHYDVSMKMGEDRLFPALRASSPEVSIAVTGVSCRQQVEDGVGRPARFLSDILAEAID
jgi:Fe-S oxidoreductase